LRNIRVAALVIEQKKWDKEANCLRAEELLRQAASQGAQVACTPESFLEGYIVEDAGEDVERYRSVGERVPEGKYLQRLARVCREVHIYAVLGLAELENGKMFNSSVLVGPDGTVIGKFRKVHASNKEGLNFMGREFPVFHTPLSAIGMMICFDRQLPETARILTLNGAEIIFNPSAGYYGEMNDTMMRTRAYENGVFVLFVHPKDALIIHPGGDIIARFEKDPLVLADLDLDASRNDILWKYRRPHLYDQLVAPQQDVYSYEEREKQMS
jgi:predicted amidohydrolase